MTKIDRFAVKKEKFVFEIYESNLNLEKSAL